MGFENGKLVRVTLEAVAGAEHQVNTFHYDLIDATLQPANDPQSLADTFRDDVVPAFAQLYLAAWTIQPVVVVQEKDPLNPTAPRSEWTSGAPVAGTNTGTGDVLPHASCGIVSLLSANIGRRHRGRLFLGGSRHESEQNDGVWGAGTISGFQDFVDAVPVQPDIAELGSDSTANWCVYSRTQRAANLDPYASHITGNIVRSEVHFLRSRANF
jgi:hypothetical protein